VVITQPLPAARKRRRVRLGDALPYVISVVFLVPVLFVFFWMVSMSFKTQVEISSAVPGLLPQSPTTVWYDQVLGRMPFLRYTLNSLVVGLASTGLGLVFGLPAAFVVARRKLTALSTLFLTARIIPAISYLIPWYVISKRLSLTDNVAVLVFLHLVITLPLIVWIMIGFFESLPDELEQAAEVDGCTRWQAFLLIAVPLVRPGIIAAALLAFISSWNNFLFAAVMSGPNSQTLPVVVYGLLAFEQANWGPLAAAASLVLAPVLLGALFLQRYLVEGLTAGAVKG
jgi:multiple sugar transport system permease protein